MARDAQFGSESVWMKTQAMPTFERLSGNGTADACIVGGGIAGLTTAYLLGQAGLSVVLLQDDEIGSGETARTTAHLSNALDQRYTEVERIHGQRGAYFAADSHSAAIRRIEQIVHDEGIACEFLRVPGYLILSAEHEKDLLIQEQAAALRARLTRVELLPRSPLEHADRPCLRFPDQAQCHPLKYLAGLAEAVRRRNGRIYTHTRAADVQGGAHPRVKTDSGWVIEAGSVIMATNTPVNNLVTMHTKQAAYRTYVIALAVPRGSVFPGLYWDTSDPYHYARLERYTKEDDLLLIGGEDHKTGQAEDTTERYGRLRAWANAWFPMAKTIVYSWSGQVMESVDGLGFIGRNPGDTNVYIATGDSGMGMTHGTIAGILLTDLLRGRENPWAALYDPARTPLGSVPEWTRENLNVATQYAKWLKPGDVGSVDEIVPNRGAVVTKGVSKLAAYRDPAGTLHVRSAVCPHLQCIVEWNDEEKTWDCPCHGSRFDRHGKVLHGPAIADLAEPS